MANEKPAAPGGDLRGSIIREIKASNIEFVVSVPDITTSEGLLRPLAGEKSPRLIRVCKEDEGIGICAGLAHCNKRALLLMQQPAWSIRSMSCAGSRSNTRCRSA
jgi:sulfopyruvate decarboxylase TPP-binding subunit